MTKKCSCCGEVKTLSEFYKERCRKDGLSYRCKTCDGSKNRAYTKSNPEKAMLASIKGRAKKSKVLFNLLPEDIRTSGECPVLKIRMERNKNGKRGAQPNSPSVDRIDPTKGYTRDNIQIISNKANMMKQDATPEELLMFAEWVIKTYKKSK